jgi:hypothetical protein
MMWIDGIIAVVSAAGILLLLASYPKGGGSNDLGHLTGITFLFFLLQVAVIGLVLPAVRRWWSGGGGQTVGNTLGLMALSGAVIFAIVTVFFLTCWGLLTVVDR